jgi:hypothetical protein
MNVVTLVKSETARPTLDALAHEINVRLQKADDHRLSACIKLAEAKEACKEAGISFKAWVAEKIEFVGYVEAWKLAKIGGADDPAKALEDFRDRARARKAKHDDQVVLRNTTGTPRKTVSDEPPARPPRGNEAVHQYLKDALIHLAVLPAPHRVLEIVKGTDTALVIEERLQQAAAFLAEFNTLWSEAHADAE